MSQADQTVTVGRPLWLANRQGRAFMASSGNFSLATLTNLRGLINNPANSGRSVIIEKLRVYQSNSGVALAQIRIDPTTNLPTTAKTISSLHPGFAAALPWRRCFSTPVLQSPVVLTPVSICQSLTHLRSTTTRGSLIRAILLGSTFRRCLC